VYAFPQCDQLNNELAIDHKVTIPQTTVENLQGLIIDDVTAD
jgi:hypothetical protein